MQHKRSNSTEQLGKEIIEKNWREGNTLMVFKSTTCKTSFVSYICTAFCLQSWPAIALSWASESLRHSFPHHLLQLEQERLIHTSCSGAHACRSGRDPEQDPSQHKSFSSLGSRSCHTRLLTYFRSPISLFGDIY